MSKDRYTPSTVIKALRQTRGIKARAAKILGCTRWTVDNYCKRYPEIMRAYLEEKENLLDESEDAFYNIIENAQHRNHWDAVRFHLSTQGRDRGYGDTDVTLEMLKNQLGDITDIDMANYTKDQLLQLRELLMIGAGKPPDVPHSDAVNAKEAIAVIRQLDKPDEIKEYITGDDRVTVQRAADKRINSLNK